MGLVKLTGFFSQKPFVFAHLFSFLKMGSNYFWVLCKKLAFFIHSVCVYIFPLLSFFSTCIFRLQKYGGSLKKNSVKELRDYGYDAKEEDKPELHLNFKFPTFEEFSKIQTGNNLYNSEVVPFVSSNKYELTSGKSVVNGFVEELETFAVREINCNKIEEFSEINEDVCLDRKFVKDYEEMGGVQEKGEVIVAFDGEDNLKNEDLRDEDEFLDDSKFCCQKNSDGFLSEGDFGGELDIDAENEKIGLENEPLGFEENKKLTDYFDTNKSYIIEEDDLQNPDGLNSDFLSEKDFSKNLDRKNDERVEIGDNLEKGELKDSLASDSVDANKLESLWEHQELIEQLRMEIRKMKATGLPTIIEESESPKIIDDLKPWKIDEKFQHEDCMGELHKFSKSYTEMMRKFDILNYQKMYAMGFLQLKDPFQPTPQHKPSTPSLRSLVSKNLWLFKHKSHGSDPIKKFINELQGDLEIVYVGQMCLSWEFLHWQYEKALDLWNSDPNGIHQYNGVASDLQQFQVLMQRFIEDERFQGPRVQSYAKSRCILRNLLQVPVIREDNMNDEKKPKKKDATNEYIFTSETLVEILEESIRIFWQFIRSDKDCNTLATSGHKKTPELHNQEDLKLLVDVRKILQKKEKKLKDILRSENCILRKFRQHKEDDSDQVLYFFSQADMKLVNRVLNMSKITKEQLIWCQSKLRKISFVNRKILVEPAFLLFPC